MKPDQQRVADMVMKTVMKLCASGLRGSAARIEGVIAVTVDDDDVFVIHIDDTVRNLSALSPVGLAVSSVPVSSMSSPGCKRARHRLVFKSPDAAQHKHNKLVESEQCGISRAVRSCNTASQASIDSKLELPVPSVYHSRSEPVSKSDVSDSTVGVGVGVGETAVLAGHVQPSVTVPHDRAPAVTVRRAVVVVDSDDEDVKLVRCSKHESLMTVCERELCADTVMTGADKLTRADTVSSLCIADVVGSVSNWSSQHETSQPVTGQTSPTVVKYDLNCCDDDDDDDDDVVTVMEEDGEVSQPWTKATPTRHFQVTFKCVFKCAQFFRAVLHFYRTTRMHSADYGVARCLSVRLPVCPSHVGILSKRLHISSFRHRVAPRF